MKSKKIIYYRNIEDEKIYKQYPNGHLFSFNKPGGWVQEYYSHNEKWEYIGKHYNFNIPLKDTYKRISKKQAFIEML